MTTFGLTAFGTLAFGEIEPAYNLATVDPFDAYRKNINAQLVYLVELYPYNTALLQTLTDPVPFGTSAFGEMGATYFGGIAPVYLSDQGFTTKPTDSLVSQYFIAQVDNPIQIETSIISGDSLGAGTQSFGSIVIANGNGKLDYIQNYTWPSRRVVVKAGLAGFAYADFATIFDGAANGLDVDDDRITITMQDYRVKTDQLLLPGTYAGTGGFEGGTDLANKPKPLCYGVVNNIEPVLIDPVNLIYQVHNGAIQWIDKVRDNGVNILNAGDTTLTTATVVPAGFFMTDLARGYVKLGSTPAGRITADVQGESGNGGFVSKAGDLVKRIVKTRLGVNSLLDTDIDAGSLNRLNDAVPGAVGLYLTERMSASAVIDLLLPPVGAYWTFSRQGQLFAGVLAPPTAPTFTITADLIDEQGVTIASTFPSAWRISVGYAPAFTVQDANELAAGTSAIDRAFVTEQYRYVSTQDDVVRAQNSQSIERTLLTTLATKADAQSLLARLSSLYATTRKVYRLTLYKSLFRFYVGDTVKLVYNRFGLSGGMNLLVVSLAEDAETGQTTVELWG